LKSCLLQTIAEELKDSGVPAENIVSCTCRQKKLCKRRYIGNILNDLHKTGSDITRETIKDNYPKYVVTRNDLIRQWNGIIHVNIGPFMKNGKMF